MMRLTQARRDPGESIVPMINVAFLLLIFFLMAAVIAPPDPVQVTLPESVGETSNPTETEIVLLVNSQGQLIAQDGSAPDLTALSGTVVTLRADAGMDAGRIAAILGDLSALGVVELRFAVAPK